MSKMEFEKSLRVNVDNSYLAEIQREKFLKKLEENPKLFFKLPIEKLKVIEKYYVELVKKEEEKLKRINKEN